MLISPFFTVTALQISQLRGISYNTARKEYKQICDSLQLNKSNPLTLRRLALYWEVPVGELTEALYSSSKK
ncbi:MAG: hypothetical protein EOO61_05115 [Hymenobacter sp.]|nr:MAG: hypothetical protein EOO61_05115 [Hymenobacter sp.]